MAEVSFNEKALSRLLYDIYNVTGIRISVFSLPMKLHSLNSGLNYRNCIAYPHEMPPCFCRSIRKSRIIDELCMDCDNNAVEIVMKTKKTYIYKCHLGFCEALVPVLLDGEVVAVFLFGQLKSGNCSPEFARIYDMSVSLDEEHFNQEQLEKLQDEFNDMKILPDESVVAFCRLIERFIPVMIQNNLISTMKTGLQTEIAYYIQKNIGRYIKLSDVTEALNISKAHLCRVMKRDFGKSFTEYVNDLKIEKAKGLLDTTNLSVSEISSKLGFDDSNYFSRLFKKKTGENTTEYKKRIKKYK